MGRIPKVEKQKALNNEKNGVVDNGEKNTARLPSAIAQTPVHSIPATSTNVLTG